MRNTKIKQVIEKCHNLHVGFKSRGYTANERISEGKWRPEEKYIH